MKVEDIPIKKIVQHKNVRIRYKTGEIEELMDSIKQEGLLQPIGLIKTGENYEVLFGNRRLEACKKLGHNYIAARLFEGRDDEDFFIANLTENLQRKDITVTELARIFQILRNKGLTNTEIASRLSISATKVKSALSMYKVPKKYQKHISAMGNDKLKKGRIPVSHADTLSKMAYTYKLTPMQVDLLFNYAREEEFNTAKLREIVILLKTGYTFEDAIKYSKNLTILRMDVAVNKKDLERLQKKYKTGKGLLLKGILYGTIKDHFIEPKNIK
jgi:ParB/RepB/Spo0J family partition protein